VTLLLRDFNQKGGALYIEMHSQQKNPLIKPILKPVAFQV